MIYKILIILLLSITLTSASTVTCTIVGDKVLTEIILTEDANVTLPQEYSTLEQSGNRISFITTNYIRKDGEYIFALPKIISGSYDLKIYLPENHILSDGLIYPKSYEISSDGKSIILDWKDIAEETVVFYEGTKNSYVWPLVIILALIILVVPVLWNFQKKKFLRELERLKKEARKERVVSQKENITTNLFGDEKRIVEFLIKNKSCWTKELAKELGISKVRLSRKIRSLMEKGLIVRENFGRENRIKLKK